MKIKRKIVQFFFSILNNSYLLFPFTRQIYKGDLKYICAPGLNCYSCPASVLACPLGSIQNFLSTIRAGKPLVGIYIWGFLGVIGIIAGRIVCGWACPFGLLQELLHKIPIKKIEINFKFAPYLKFLFLIVLVILMPIFLIDQFGYGETSFCKYFCPAGTLEAGATLPLLIPSLKKLIGVLYYYKMTILFIFIISFILIKRPFCRYFCPLGAIYSLFNKFSIVNIEKLEAKCIKCKKCVKVCSMSLKLEEIPANHNCIRCFNCIKICPAGALRITFK